METLAGVGLCVWGCSVHSLLPAHIPSPRRPRFPPEKTQIPPKQTQIPSWEDPDLSQQTQTPPGRGCRAPVGAGGVSGAPDPQLCLETSSSAHVCSCVGSVVLVAGFHLFVGSFRDVAFCFPAPDVFLLKTSAVGVIKEAELT